MTPTKPTFDISRCVPGTQEITFAKDQPEYIPLPAYITPDGVVVTCWMPNEEELAALNRGEPATPKPALPPNGRWGSAASRSTRSCTSTCPRWPSRPGRPSERTRPMEPPTLNRQGYWEHLRDLRPTGYSYFWDDQSPIEWRVVNSTEPRGLVWLRGLDMAPMSYSHYRQYSELAQWMWPRGWAKAFDDWSAWWQFQLWRLGLMATPEGSYMRWADFRLRWPRWRR